jgi:hypothetical protein
LSATGKDQKGKKFFVDLLMWSQCMCLCTQFYGKLGTGTFPMDCMHPYQEHAYSARQP